MQHYIAVGIGCSVVLSFHLQTPPSLFFALICWQHWNEKYLSLQQQQHSTSTLGGIRALWVWEMDHLRSDSPLPVNHTFGHEHSCPSLGSRSCRKQNPSPPATASLDSYSIYKTAHTPDTKGTHTHYMHAWSNICIFMCLQLRPTWVHFAHAGSHSVQRAARMDTQLFCIWMKITVGEQEFHTFCKDIG